jgi:hypothetical protein
MAFWPIALLASYVCLWLAARIGGPTEPLPLIVMIAIVPLVNLPFDWASIGVTRALLRRGCEDHGRWYLRSPIVLGLLDFALGLVLLAALAAALIVALFAADWAAGRVPVVNVEGLLEAIRENPRDAKHYWVYLTLFSTLIPSVLNALIGVFSLVTWSIRPARRWMLAEIPSLYETGHAAMRLAVAGALSGQVFVGVLLTGAGFWLVWQAALQIPFVESGFLQLLQDFAAGCAKFFGVLASKTG